MGILKNALSILDEAQRAFNDFDFDTTVDSLMKTSKNAFDGFNGFMKTIKDSVSDFKIVIPFNEKKEKFTIDINDDVITVTVKGKGSKKQTTATIPSNCIVDRLRRFVDKENGNLVVVIPKDVAKDENLKKFKENVTTKVNKTASWLRDALKERAESVAASTTAPTAKHHNKPTAKAKPKIVRDKNGRFVSATKKAKA